MAIHNNKPIFVFPTALVMNKQLYASALKGWMLKQPLKIYLKEDGIMPLIGIVIAFGKTGYINHFDVVSILEVAKLKKYSAADRLNQREQSILNIDFKDISSIEFVQLEYD